MTERSSTLRLRGLCIRGAAIDQHGGGMMVQAWLGTLRLANIMPMQPFYFCTIEPDGDTYVWLQAKEAPRELREACECGTEEIACRIEAQGNTNYGVVRH